MKFFHIILFIWVGIIAAATVLTRNPLHQAMVLGLYGLVLTILFVSLQAPDVAFSELVIGSAALPLMILIALQKIGGKEE